MTDLRYAFPLAATTAALGIGLGLVYPGVAQEQELDEITFTTSWYAQAEHGGYYQAVATGIYEKYGLDVTVEMGGPQVNPIQLLVGGVSDFVMASESLSVLKPREEGLPVVAVAALFQKSPRVLIAHPDITELSQLQGRPIFVSKTAVTSYWPFLVSQFDFSDDQIRTYNFSVSPFINDPESAQQAYLTSEPFAVENEGGFSPSIFMLADEGFNPYGNLIATTEEMVETNPDLVQRFVDATIEGYYSYLEDPTPGNELIQQDNPEMTDGQLAFAMEKFEEFGIFKSGDALELGIGAMTEERWQSFIAQMMEYEILTEGTDYGEVYTLEYANKGVDAYID